MDPTAQTQETLCWELSGKWDNMILSGKQLALLSPPQAGACTCSFCSAVQKLQLALVTAPLEGTMGLQRSHCEWKGIVHPILLSL